MCLDVLSTSSESFIDLNEKKKVMFKEGFYSKNGVDDTSKYELSW